MENRAKGLNNLFLKIIAMITMTIDHIGLILLGDYTPFRIIGKIAFPIYAYLIAEGCIHTRNKKRYFFQIFFLGLACQMIYFFAEQDFYLGILLTFSVSILLIYSTELAKKDFKKICVPIIAIFLAWFFCEFIPSIELIAGLEFDYGFAGVMLPVIISIFREKKTKLLATAVGLVLVSIYMGGIQWFCFMALIPLLLYNNEYGKKKYKYLFYVFYPLHLALIYGVSILMELI